MKKTASKKATNALPPVGDSNSATGRLMLNLLASVSQWEREAIGEQTAETHFRCAGVKLGGEALTDEHGRRIVADVMAESRAVSRMLERLAARQSQE